MKNYIYFTILFLINSSINAQTINLEFPYLAGKTYDFTIFQGEKRVVLQADTIPKGGKVKLLIPKEYKGYKGMATWYITNSSTGGGLDLVINNENFSVSCLDSIPTEQNIIYKNTQENLFDKTNYKKQQALFEKHDALLATTRAFGTDTELYKLASKEYENIKKQYVDYNKSLSTSTVYAAKFRQIVNLTMGIGSIITLDEQKKANNINDFITNELDFELLYTSNHWGGVINNWVQIHSMVIKDDVQLEADAKTILSRIDSDKVYTDFVYNLTKELTKAGKDNVLAKLTPTIKNSKRLLNYSGFLSMYQQDLTGKAPDLVITEHIGKLEDHNHNTTTIETNKLDSKYSLLIFYQSGCGPCEDLMMDLQQKYQSLKEKEVRVITISADEGELLYKNTSRDYPWQDKYCDFEGKQGINFKNYGVIGTPTMFLLDSEGIIVEKMATIEQLLAWSKEK